MFELNQITIDHVGPLWNVLLLVGWVVGSVCMGDIGWKILQKYEKYAKKSILSFELFSSYPIMKVVTAMTTTPIPLNHRLLTIEYSVAEYSLFINELYVDNECHVLLMLPGAFWRIDDPNCLIATSTKARHSCIVYKYLLLSAWEWWVRLIQMTVKSLKFSFSDQ